MIIQRRRAAHGVPGEASNSTQPPLKSHNISGVNPSLKTTDKSGEGFSFVGADFTIRRPSKSGKLSPTSLRPAKNASAGASIPMKFALMAA